MGVMMRNINSLIFLNISRSNFENEVCKELCKREAKRRIV
jgi:hypothetical protein